MNLPKVRSENSKRTDKYYHPNGSCRTTVNLTYTVNNAKVVIR